MVYEINIMMGLPGSGKSTFIQKDIKSSHSKAFILDLDAVMKTYKDINDAVIALISQSGIVSKWFHGHYDKLTAYIDGLILTVDNLNKVIAACKSQLPSDSEIIFNIHHWNLDRNKCLNNDTYRIMSGKRNKSAKSTILHAKFDNIDSEFTTNFDDTCKYNVIKHDVFKQDLYTGVFKIHESCRDEGYMYSNSWSLGGEEGNCWNDTMCPIESEPQLDTFREFESLVWHIAPDIKFWEYKKLYNACVTIDTETEYGYYGSWEKIASYKCDLKKLYKMMSEMNLIKEVNNG